MTYQKPMIETVLFSEESNIVTISTNPQPGPNEMPLA